MSYRGSFVTKLSGINVGNWSKWAYGLIEKYKNIKVSDDLQGIDELKRLNDKNPITNQCYQRILSICLMLSLSDNKLVKNVLFPAIKGEFISEFANLLTLSDDIPYIVDESTDDSKVMKLFYELIYVGGIVYFTRGDSEIDKTNEKLTDFVNVVKNFESSGLQSEIVEKMARVYVLYFHRILINSLSKQTPYLRYLLDHSMHKFDLFKRYGRNGGEVRLASFFFISKIFVNKRCLEWEVMTPWNDANFIQFQEDEMLFGEYEPTKLEFIEIESDEIIEDDYIESVRVPFGTRSRVGQSDDELKSSKGRFIPQIKDLIQSEVPLLYVISIKK